MSDEYSESTPETPSIFWPLLVLVLGLLLWAGYQDFAENVKRGYLKQNLTDAQPIFDAARAWEQRYGALMQDLGETGKKDPYAAQIFRLAIAPSVQAGLMNVQQAPANGAAGGTNAAPAAPSAPASSTPAPATGGTH
jgi:hypothetical protein